MLFATVAAKGAAVLGWITIFAVDFHAVQVNITNPLHNALLGALMVASVAVVIRRPGNRGGRTYSEGVVDGIKLASGCNEETPPRNGPGAKVLYLHGRQASIPCTRRAPKPVRMRSSS